MRPINRLPRRPTSSSYTPFKSNGTVFYYHFERLPKGEWTTRPQHPSIPPSASMPFVEFVGGLLSPAGGGYLT